MTEEHTPNIELIRQLFWEEINHLDEYLDEDDGAKWQLANRLKNYPEMKLFWPALFEWTAERNPKASVTYTSLPEKMMSFAMMFIEDKTLITAISANQRQEIIDRICKHAKMLSRAMRELHFPQSVHFYLPYERSLTLIEEVFSDIGHSMVIKPLSEFDYAKAEWNDGSDQGRLRVVADRLLDNWCLSNPYADDEFSILKIYEVLAALSDDKILLGALPRITV